MFKNYFYIIILFLFLVPHPAYSQGSETQSYQTNPDEILKTAKTVAKIKWESWAAPEIIAVLAEKVYWGKGNPKHYLGGWIEGKSYTVDLQGTGWKKSWESMNPKFEPFGKENIIFVAENGKLIAVGEIRGSKIGLTCSRPNEKCQVGPQNEISLSMLTAIK